MLVKTGEFNIIKAHLGYQLESDEELKEVIKNIEERAKNRRKYVADKVREKRKENPEYARSKSQIEYMKDCKKRKEQKNAKRELGIQ